MVNSQSGQADQGSGAARPLFLFSGVAVRFGQFEALSGVDLSVTEGQVTVLTGPSGAGKTTLLRLCNRLEVPSTGSVEFRGQDVSTLDPLAQRRRVGMVFQRPILFPGTLHDNFLVAGPVPDRTCEEALGMVGLPCAWLDRPADQLSGGEAQRACLARTLATDPDVLLMDEPTSSLDEGASRTLEHLTTDLAGAGLSVIWVSHDLAQVKRIADSIVVLMDGQIVGEERAVAYLAHGPNGDATGDEVEP